MKILFKTEARQCGDCSLCCKVLGVLEGDFHKPKDQWCQYAVKRKGCGIYSTRPTKCRDFECLWLQQKFGGPEHRPDKIHAVITPTTDGRNWIILEDPGWPGHARGLLKSEIDAWLASGMDRYVIAACGDRRSFFGDQRMFKLLRARNVPEVADAQNITTDQHKIRV